MCASIKIIAFVMTLTILAIVPTITVSAQTVPAVEGSQKTKLQQPLDKPSDSENVSTALRDTSSQDTITVGWDEGFVLRSSDGHFELNLGGWLQTRYQYNEATADSEALSSIYMRRVRLDVRGQLGEQVTFRIMPELARAVSLRDAWVNYAFSQQLQIRAGQFTVPFQWHRSVGARYQHFAERGLPGESFGVPTGRDLGVMMHGQNEGSTVSYGVGFFSGSGPNTHLSNSAGNLVSARARVAILGQLPREEVDFRRSELPNLSLGAGLQAANKNEVRAWDLGRSPNGLSAGNFATATSNINFRWQGFSLAADGYLRRVWPDWEEIDSYQGAGYMISAGVAILPELIEAVGRYSTLRWDLDDVNTAHSEWGIGLNIYHNGHASKTRIQYLRDRHFIGDGFASAGVFLIEYHIQF